MTRRQFIGDPDDVVPDALAGLEIAHGRTLVVHRDPTFVARRELTPMTVGLVSGGGSGHEPLHTGFVGPGMLTVAVPGAVFASPTALQVAAATAHADTGSGVVQIVKNYTGDVLNFTIAAEIARDDGREVHTVLVDDDLATQTDDDGPGRRGTAAVVVVEKVCGAMAEAGADAPAVTAAGRRVVDSSRSMALALAAGAHPGEDAPPWDLPPDEVEFGVGIHGERGIGRRPFGPASALVDLLVDPLAADLSLARGDDVLVVVNGLGATHDLELGIVLGQVQRALSGRGVRIARALVGSYVTSLDMAGVSVTLTRADDDLLRWWDVPVRTPALTW